MRIACAQFSPQVGDADNNLNRADAVLNKALPEHFESLDLLVLPELAFTGRPLQKRFLLPHQG
jgi:predicted amidohydrolase